MTRRAGATVSAIRRRGDTASGLNSAAREALSSSCRSCNLHFASVCDHGTTLHSASHSRNVGPTTLQSPCAFPRASPTHSTSGKWSLLVAPAAGKRTYGELAHSPEGVPTNILAERLKRLESAGIVARAPYQERPVRYAYTLTPKGSALGEVLLALVRWGKQHIPGTVTLNQGPAGGEVAASATKSRRRRSRRAG
jgi:DNA-binding HxlR family transcriptional regulator